MPWWHDPRHPRRRACATSTSAATRDRIAVAAIKVLTESPASFSVPAVAQAAGVSVRTVYRHFPTKEALVAGASAFGGERTTAAFVGGVHPENLDRYLHALLPELWANRDAIGLHHTTQAGRELRGERMRGRRDDVRGFLAEVGVTGDDLDRPG